MCRSNREDGAISVTYLSANEQATDRLGQALADVLEGGMVVALVGDLGSGKTRLVQATATALGVPRDEVNSPTFVLINEYPGPTPVYHFDAYRLRDADEFLDLGPDEYFQSPGISFVEWADRVADCLPEKRIEIGCTVAGPTSRRYEIAAPERIEQALAALLAP